MISIIIPVHNRFDYLDRAIRSVLEQSVPQVEIIVVDDGSDSDPARVLEPFGGRIRLLRKANGGPTSARNFGIANARGEYLNFLDDDDFLEPTALEVLLGAIRSRPGSVWATGRFVHVDTEGRRMDSGPRSPLHSGDAYAQFISHNMIGAMSAVLLEASTVRAVGSFDEQFTMAEDYDLWLTLARDHPIVATGEVVTNYRMHGNQSSSRWALHYEHILRVLEKHRGRSRPGFDAEFDASIARWLHSYGDALYFHGRPAEARQYWRRSSAMPGGISGVQLSSRLAKSYLPPIVIRGLRRTKDKLSGHRMHGVPVESS